MIIKDNLKYTKSHEWVKIDGDSILIGITDFAQSSLGDIIYLELPENGLQVEKDQAICVIESVKSVSDIHAPISGEITEINNALSEAPEAFNDDAYSAWIARIKISNNDQLSELMDPEDYQKICEEQ